MLHQPSLFGQQVERYFSYFEKSQFQIITLKQLEEDPLSTIQTCYEFLEVNRNFTPDLKILNEGKTSKIPQLEYAINFKLNKLRSRLVYRIIRFIRKYNITNIPPQNLGTRQALSVRFENDLKLFFNLTGIKFT